MNTPLHYLFTYCIIVIKHMHHALFIIFLSRIQFMYYICIVFILIFIIYMSENGCKPLKIVVIFS